MDHWNNKNAVIRDLEKVSRGRLKFDIDPCLTAGKPITCFGEEETEEEFFKRHCSGDANFDSPDLESIRKLLFMVRENDDNYEKIREGPLQISKLNASAVEFLPTEYISKTNNDNEVKKKPAKVKRGNVAITSILAKQLELIKKESLEKKLFKPEDFTVASKNETIQKEAIATKAKIVATTAKPNYPKNETPLKPKELPLNITKANMQISCDKNNEKTLKAQNGFVMPAFSSPSSMFRRKTPKASLPQENVENSSAVQTPGTQEIPKRRSYVPSPYAEEYYKKFVENNEVRRAVSEDLWSRTMRQMKILDKKREEELTEKLNVSKNTESVSDNAESVENLFQNLPECDFYDSETPKSPDGSSSEISITASCARTFHMSGFPDKTYLPQHRHQLTGECEVCKAVYRAFQLKVNGKTSSVDVSQSSIKTPDNAFENSVDASDSSVNALVNSVETSEKIVEGLENSLEILDVSLNTTEDSVEASENFADASENLIEFSESSSMCSPSNGLLINLE